MEEEKKSSDNEKVVITSRAIDRQTDPNEPPDGGMEASIQVALGFFTLFNSWGIVNTFGVYQNYYQETLMKHESPSTISWIGTIQAFTVISVPIVTGRLLDGGYLRSVLCVGAFLNVFGWMMLSLSKEFYQCLLSQGFCVGIGCACLFSSGINTVAQYFKKRRATAIGIVASGSSLGGVIYPIIVQRLIPQVGYPWATRIIGFIVLATTLPACIFMKARLPPRPSGPFLDYASFKDAPYMLFSVGSIFNFMGLFVPIFYIEAFAQSHNINQNAATYIVSILNAASVFGRIVPNIVADKTGNLNIMIPSIFFAGILAYVWIAVKNTGGTIVFAILYGLLSGVLVSMPGPVVANMTSDMSKLGTRLGFMFGMGGLGVLCGSPVAGALIDRMDGGYLGAQLFGATSLMIGVGCMTASRLVFTRGKLISKA